MAWQTALLEIDGKPAHSMVNDQFAANPPVDQLPHLMWFSVFCATDPGNHFWNPDEGPRLDAIENDLIRLCIKHGHGWAVYVQRLDTRGVREYYVYCGEGASLENVLPELKAAHPDYRLESERIDDLKWSQYRKWLGWLATAHDHSARGPVSGVVSKARKWFGRDAHR